MKKILTKSVVLLFVLSLVIAFLSTSWLKDIRTSLIWINQDVSIEEKIIYLKVIISTILIFMNFLLILIFLMFVKKYDIKTKIAITAFFVASIIVWIVHLIMIQQLHKGVFISMLHYSLHIPAIILFTVLLIFQPRWQILGNTRQQFIEAKAEFKEWKAKRKMAKNEELESVKKELEKLKEKMRDMEDKK